GGAEAAGAEGGAAAGGAEAGGPEKGRAEGATAATAAASPAAAHAGRGPAAPGGRAGRPGPPRALCGGAPRPAWSPSGALARACLLPKDLAHRRPARVCGSDSDADRATLGPAAGQEHGGRARRPDLSAGARGHPAPDRPLGRGRAARGRPVLAQPQGQTARSGPSGAAWAPASAPLTRPLLSGGSGG